MNKYFNRFKSIKNLLYFSKRWKLEERSSILCQVNIKSEKKLLLRVNKDGYNLHIYEVFPIVVW